ncbi:30S ribosomal protein S20 [Candidatus Peregrinibacteria bacterium]|nr:30S ribosomal protein S20 [Candidatus Peregrinibacteria bacterium]
MPIIKSAKKRVLQSAKRQARNYGVRATLKKSIKAVLEQSKAGNKAEAEKLLSAAYKVIDTAAKKHILNKKTAGRRKSMLTKAIAKSGIVKTETEAKVAKPKKAPSKTKKAAKKE